MGAVTRVTGPTPDMQAPGEGVSAWHERAVHERDLWRCSVAVCGKASKCAPANVVAGFNTFKEAGQLSTALPKQYDIKLPLD
jgi:hypothetical protein